MKRGFPLVMLALVLGACASAPPDRGFADVARHTREHSGVEAQRVRSEEDRLRLDARVRELLAKPLDAEAAVEIALLNNRGLRAAYFELDIAAADLVQAGRLPNPGFSIGRFRAGEEVEWERSVHLNIARLIAMPLATRVERERFAGVQQTTALQALAVAHEARQRWVDAVAAIEMRDYWRQVNEASSIGAELAQRMTRAGNWSALRLAREQGVHAEAALNLARAEASMQRSREALIRVLGLWGEQTPFQLPARLPALPDAVRDEPDIEQRAMASRLDLQAARAQTESLARNLGLSRSTRFINVLELGYSSKRSNEAPTQRGYEISFEIPLFDWSTAKSDKAEALYMQQAERLAQTAIDARSEVRQAYRDYRNSHDIARHYRDEVLPLRKRIAEESLLRYNGMLIGVFDLIADARAQMASASGYIDTLREYWLAEAALRMSLAGPAAPRAPAAPSVSAGGEAAGH